MVRGCVSASGMVFWRLGLAVDEGGGVGAVFKLPCNRHPPLSLQWCLQRWWMHPFRMCAELQLLVRHLISVD